MPFFPTRPTWGYRCGECELDACGALAWRTCRLCDRWVCRDHRFGSGQWFRCYECPAEALREARELWESQVREERAAERAAREEADARAEALGPPHLAPPGTFRAGVWWGLGVPYRMGARLRKLEHVRQLQEQLREKPPTPAPPGARGKTGPRRGRALPGLQLRRYTARRRGYAFVMARRAPPAAPRAAPRWAPVARAAVAAAVVCALALVPVRLVLAPPAPVAHLVAEARPELALWRTNQHANMGTRLGGEPQPLKGQKKAPCTPGLEVELSGYCWLPVKARPPNCPKQTVAYAGDCLLPLAPTPRPPTSLDAATGQ